MHRVRTFPSQTVCPQHRLKAAAGAVDGLWWRKWAGGRGGGGKEGRGATAATYRGARRNRPRGRHCNLPALPTEAIDGFVYLANRSPEEPYPAAVFEHWTGVLVFIRPRNPSVSQESEGERDRTETEQREREQREGGRAPTWSSPGSSGGWCVQYQLCGIWVTILVWLWSCTAALGYFAGFSLLFVCFVFFVAVALFYVAHLCQPHPHPHTRPIPNPPAPTTISPTSRHYII